MRIEKCIPESQDIVLMSQAEEVRAIQIFLAALSNKRDALRAKNENNPKQCPDKLVDDWRYIAGMIGAINWAMSLPEQSREFVSKIK